MIDVMLKLPESQVDIKYILFLLRMSIYITSLNPLLLLKFPYQACTVIGHVYVSILSVKICNCSDSVEFLYFVEGWFLEMLWWFFCFFILFFFLVFFLMLFSFFFGLSKYIVLTITTLILTKVLLHGTCMYANFQARIIVHMIINAW